MKTKFILFTVIIICSLSLSSCKSGAEENKNNSSDNPQENSEDTSSPETGVLKNLKDFSDNMEKAAEDMKNGNSPKPVNFRKIKEFLPLNAAGIPRENASGETSGAMGFTISQAEGKYRYEDKSKNERIDITIMDGAATQIAFMGLAAWSLTTIDKEDDNGFERTLNYKGGKAYQKYNQKNQDGEFITIGGKRFIVTVKGRNVSMDQIKEAMDQIDLKGLTALQPDEE